MAANFQCLQIFFCLASFSVIPQQLLPVVAMRARGSLIVRQ